VQKKIAVLLSLVVLFFLSSRPIFAVDVGWMDASLYLFQDNGASNDCYYPDCISENQNLKFKGNFSCNVKASNFFESHGPQVAAYYFTLVDLCTPGDPIPEGSKVKIRINDSSGKELQNKEADVIGGKISTIDLGSLPTSGTYHLRIDWKVKGDFYTKILDTTIGIQSECTTAEVSLCGEEKTLDSIQWKLCNQISDATITKCQICLADKGIWTAVGCIPTNSTKMIQVLIKIGLLIGGGVALLVILMGAFSLSISEGDPKKTSEAKDQITAAIIGLIFIIFSISILQLIGVQILHIPEFGQ